MLTNEKIIESYPLEDYEVETDSGWQPITDACKTIPFDLWEIKTQDFTLTCADKHIVFGSNEEQLFTCDLKPGQLIKTRNGNQLVISITHLDKPPENMYDFSVDSEDHTYYTDGILSHNTLMTCIFALWVVIFNEDQRVLLVANKEDTAIRIFKKIRLAYELLPNYLKSGVIEYGKTSLTLANGSSIGISATSSDAGRGDSANLLLIDECVTGSVSITLQGTSGDIPGESRTCSIEEVYNQLDNTNCSLKKNTKWKVLTDTGFSNFDGVKKVISKDIIQLHLSDGTIFKCTENHKLLKRGNTLIKAKSIKKNTQLIGKNNIYLTVIKKEYLVKETSVYDLINVEKNRRYYTDNIVSSNCAHIPAELLDGFWASVYPIISASTKSKIFAVSTPNGTNNLFHKLFTNAERGANNWKAERVDWWEVEGRDEKWKENTIKEMGSLEMFQQEYENVFHQSGESSVPDEIYNKLKQNCREPKYIFDDGHYKVWEDPNKESIYVAGVDVSEGVNEAASVIQIFDITDLTDIHQVATYHHSKMVPYAFTAKLFKILQNWGCPPAAIERNNCGGQIIDQLRNTYNYENIINFSPKNDNNEHRLGCISHTNTKQKGVTNMRYWVNQLNVVVFRDIETINELKDFTRYPNGTWAAKPGNDIWDDRVMAFVWALIILDPAVTEKFFEIVKYDDYRKPLIIRPYDYGTKRAFVNPLQTFRDEQLDIHGTRVLPVLMDSTPFGMEESNPDIDELEQMGYERMF
jgi:hypothetical protein